MTQVQTGSVRPPRRLVGYNRRTASREAVLTVRTDDALRKKAVRMIRAAEEILRRTPTQAENARRLGLSRDTVKGIVEWRTYKEIR